MLTVRAPRLSFASIPKYWFAGSFAATHLVNGVNLLFPAGERFFIRSVKHYLPQLEGPLAERVRGFFGQEGRHAYSHERFFDAMREQGYAIDEFLSWYEDVAYGYIEKHSPAALSLAVTVACEHFTALMAEDALANDGELLVHAHPELRNLLAWHAVEELEHKSVAFDVLKAVHPSYVLRMGGLLLATLCLGGFWVAATKRLLEQDGLTLVDCERELRQMRKTPEGERVGESVATGVFLKGILEYIRPGFHPDDKDHRALVEQTLARLVAVGVVAAQDRDVAA